MLLFIGICPSISWVFHEIIASRAFRSVTTQSFWPFTLNNCAADSYEWSHSLKCWAFKQSYLVLILLNDSSFWTANCLTVWPKTSWKNCQKLLNISSIVWKKSSNRCFLWNLFAHFLFEHFLLLHLTHLFVFSLIRSKALKCQTLRIIALGSLKREIKRSSLIYAKFNFIPLVSRSSELANK
jgi:hypothetical protein